MAFSAVTARGSAVDTTSDTTLAMSPSANLTVGKLVVVCCATTNETTVDGASSQHSLADSQGNIWVKVAEYTETVALDDDGTTISMFYTVVTSQIGTGNTITLTTANAEAEKIICCFEATFDNTNNNIRVEQVGLGQNAIEATVSGMTSRAYLLIGNGGARGSDSSKTPDADYSEQFDIRSRNNALAVTNHVQTRIATLTGDTVTSTAWTNTTPVTMLAALHETPFIAPADVAITTNNDADTISQNHVVAVNDANIGLTADNDTISQDHIVSLADVAIGLSEDNGTVSEVALIGPDDMALNTPVDASDFTQDHIIAMNDILVGVSEDNDTISQNQILVLADMLVGLLEDSNTINQIHNMTVQDILINTREDNADVDDEGGLELHPADIFIGLIIDDGRLRLTPWYNDVDGPFQQSQQTDWNNQSQADWQASVPQQAPTPNSSNWWNPNNTDWHD